MQKTKKQDSINLSELHPNPNNPRKISPEQLEGIVKSIKQFPKMLSIRPIVTDDNGIILGGNMRFLALQKMGYKSIPQDWVKRASDFTEAEKREFVIKDNSPVGISGEWDFDILKTDWDKDLLIDWGIEFPIVMDEPTGGDLIGEVKNKPACMKITFPTPEDLQRCESEIQEVINRLCPKAFYSVSAGEI